MINKKIGIFILLLCFCILWMPFHGLAVSTSDAVEPIQCEKECSLTVSYGYEDAVFSGLQVNLYRVAEVSADFKYTLTEPFGSSGLVLDEIKTSGEWNVLRSTLEAHILAHNINPDFSSITNEEGKASFDALKTGMYLAIVSQATQDDFHCRFDSALISLPGLEQDGHWQYQVSANAKGEVLPPVDPDKDQELKVLKLWKGDENRNDRPESVTVEIFRNGISYKTVLLSEENHWAYSWSAKDDGSNWSVVERNIPQGYTVTVEERQSSFVVTNTRIPDSDDPVDPPKTGDTFNVLPYIFIMIGSGMMLIILGVTGKKNRYEER